MSLYRKQGSRSAATLVLLRHGQSVWNKRPTFTGWCDVELTERGRREAREAGDLLGRRGYGEVDAAFTSDLSRAWTTCRIVLEELGCANLSMRRDRRLNERHYGALQGLPKDSAELVEQYGAAQVRQWRRSLASRPPAMTSDHPYYDSSAPLTESLADCRERALQCFEEVVAPTLFAARDTIVLIVAHSNTLRGLISHFDVVPDDRVPGLHVPNSVPIVYDFDTSTRRPMRAKLTTTSGTSHARWLLSEENQAKIAKALQPGGLLARALFEAWDLDQSLTLDPHELHSGLQSVSHDVALSAIARRIVRRLHFDGAGLCTRAEFDKRAAEVAAELRLERAAAATAAPPPRPPSS